tara:strand:+ start:17 stop:1177 length:1161 start_codon:yes stop_codon:yes gene_type:complete
MSHAARKAHLGLTILGCFGGGSLYGWSGYLPAVRAHFSVSNAAASMVFSLALVSFTLGVLLGPLLLAKVSKRLRLPLIAGLAALSLGLAGASTGFAGFVIAYGVCFGFAAGAFYNHAISEASASASATLLVPVSVGAFGLGGAAFGPVQVWLTASGWGLWSSAPALATLAVTTVVALVVRPLPKANRAEPLRPPPLTKPDRTIAILAIIFAAGSYSGLIVLGLASQMLPRAETGVGFASLAIFLAAMGNTLGRLSSALIAGRFGPVHGIAGAMALSMITLGGLIFTSAPGVVVGLLFLVAFAYGQLAATMPLLVRSQVSGEAFSGSFGWVFTGWGAAGLIGPWTAGWLLDATGTVRVSLLSCIALAGLSLWLVLKFTKPGRAKEDC